MNNLKIIELIQLYSTEFFKKKKENTSTNDSVLYENLGFL